jgi:hypothetical protein
VSVHDDLSAAINTMPVSERPVPTVIDPFWVQISRLCLDGWAKEIERDADRATAGLDIARAAQGEPTDDQVTGLEEAFWRLRSAAEKVDALIAVAYGPAGLHPYDRRSKGLQFRPDRRENGRLLKAIGSPSALAVRAARAALEGERATLRRHQLMHSIVPIAKLHDLAPYIVVHHRDGRIIPGGFELSRLTPAKWDEGISSAAPGDLFRRRLHEAERSGQKLATLLEALAGSLPVDARIEVPPFVYLEEDERIISLELPASTGPVRNYKVRFVVENDPSVADRVFSSQRLTRVGEELPLEGGVWRAIRVEEGTGDTEDQVVYCRRTPHADT